MKEIYFIVNLQARNGRCRDVWNKVEQQLEKEGIVYHALFTEFSGHATQLVQSIMKHTEAKEIWVIGVGGDGTIHEIANGAVERPNVRIGYIPGGSGSDFSRGFMVPRDTDDALNLILRQHSFKKIDVGKVKTSENKERYFVNNMGAGFDAAICLEANQSEMKARLNRFSLGSLAYALILIKKLFTYRCTDMVITIDEDEVKVPNAWFATVSNQAYFGGGMKIAPKALPTDGILDLVVVHNLSKWKLLFVFVTVFWGGHTEFSEVRFFKGRKITIQSSKPVVVHGDGEVIGETPVTIQACKDALTLV